MARKAHLLAGLSESSQQLERLIQDETDRATRETHLQQSWADLWQSLEITPLPPAEMRQWLEQRTRILALATDARNRRDQIAKHAAVLDSQRARLSACLRNLGEPELALGESLADGLKTRPSGGAAFRNPSKEQTASRKAAR